MLQVPGDNGSGRALRRVMSHHPAATPLTLVRVENTAALTKESTSGVLRPAT
jgi:hypothetical protein